MPASKTLVKRWVKPEYSWSQYNRFVNQGWPEYAKTYIYGENRTNPAMELGKYVADMIEHDTAQEDTTFEHLRVFLPKAQHHEFEIKVPFLSIPILRGYLDGFTITPQIAVDEYKTGRLWTQKMADETEQLDWYALLVHLKFGIKPQDIPLRLVWMPTEWNNGNPYVTGHIEIFETRRTMGDMIKIGKKIVDSWNKLGDLVAAEYKNIGI